MKKLFFLFVILVLFSGCESQPENRPVEEWSKNAALDADDSIENLYEKALNEGNLTIYSSSTRMVDVAKSFEKQYPGLVVKVHDIRSNETIDMLRDTVDSGRYDCDIILCSAGAEMENELLAQGYVFRYAPGFLEDKLVRGKEKLLPLMYEAVMFAYNDSAYEKPPISNWWELTEEKWKGKIMMPNPTRSETTFGFLSMIVQNERLFEEAYKAGYGKEIETLQGEGAGKTFIRKLYLNGLTLTNSSDEVAESVGAPGLNEQAVGIMISSKLRLRNVGYTMAVAADLTPFSGAVSQNSIMLAAGAKNVNSAKLFIRWIFGEADGQGEGYKPYIQAGSWPTRADVKGESDVSLNETNLIYLDNIYTYENKNDLMDFWVSLVESK